MREVKPNPNQVGEIKPPELLRRALKDAMSRFAGEAQRELKHTAALRRRNSLQHVAALSVRRIELGSSLLLSMRGQASNLNMLSRPVPQPPSPAAGPLGRLFTRRASRKDDASRSSRSTRGTAGRLVGACRSVASHRPRQPVQAHHRPHPH